MKTMIERIAMLRLLSPLFFYQTHDVIFVSRVIRGQFGFLFGLFYNLIELFGFLTELHTLRNALIIVGIYDGVVSKVYTYFTEL